MGDFNLLREGIKIFVCVLCLMPFSKEALSQTEKISPSVNKESFIYAVKDSSQLGLDIYTPKDNDSNYKKPVIIFAFGGAFIGGHRDDSVYNKYFNNLVENKYIVVSISYRLGLKGVKHLSKFNIAPLKKAIDMAVADTYDATNWVIVHASSLGIDTSKIILSGSSSGAITMLGAEFGRRNESMASNILPAGFEYAGVIAFSGAVLTYDGSLKYKIAPSPALMFHGTADHIVPYQKIRFFNKGFYGSAWIAKTFKEKNYPYYLYSEEGLGHEVAVLPMYNSIPIILDFLDKYIIQKKRYEINVEFKDPDTKPVMLMDMKELMDKLQHP
jgi:predicted esterase